MSQPEFSQGDKVYYRKSDNPYDRSDVGVVQSTYVDMLGSIVMGRYAVVKFYDVIEDIPFGRLGHV